MESESEHVWRGVSEIAEVAVELREFAFNIKSIEYFYLFKATLNSLRQGMLRFSYLAFGVDYFKIGLRSHGTKETGC